MFELNEKGMCRELGKKGEESKVVGWFERFFFSLSHASRGRTLNIYHGYWQAWF